MSWRRQLTLDKALTNDEAVDNRPRAKIMTPDDAAQPGQAKPPSRLTRQECLAMCPANSPA